MKKLGYDFQAAEERMFGKNKRGEQSTISLEKAYGRILATDIQQI